MRVGAAGSDRVALAALVCVKAGHRPRLFYRTHIHHGHRRNDPKGFTATDHVHLLDAAHQRLGGPIVLVWDNLNTHTSKETRALIDARPWLTVHRLPPYAPELNPVEAVWAHLKRSLANFTKRTIDQLAALTRTRLAHIQRHPDLITGFLAKTPLNPTPPL
ncbi:putative transposase [Actinorugispora endophytica]|uniref:Putative transposase n=1 Tax=Actinorugispora endophytica TaxID=1605990 RepID=A0A4R6UYN2_9ACTN|nr:putative transposase [Actinorugispora endophytica]